MMLDESIPLPFCGSRNRESKLSRAESLDNEESGTDHAQDGYTFKHYPEKHIPPITCYTSIPELARRSTPRSHFRAVTLENSVALSAGFPTTPLLGFQPPGRNRGRHLP